jgi:hypothetical protein
MGFALEENEPIPVAVTRMAVEQIDLALGHLRGPSEDIHKSIHATRQSLKRIRALLALARDELSNKVFVREWACYRDIGRLLAGGRDAAVVVETLDALVRHFSSELAADAFASTRRFLADRRDARVRILIEEEGALKKAYETLASARERVATWPVRRQGFKAFGGGVRNTYRASREGFRTVVRHPSPTNFHEWRRPVKLLLHQLQILTPIWPAILNAYACELQALSDRLNSHHDLYILSHAALRSQSEVGSPDRKALVTFVDRRYRELEVEGLQFGDRLYAELPRRFTARLEHYWHTWRREAVGRAG